MRVNYMKFIAAVPLIKDSFTLTLPKKVRAELRIIRQPYRVLSFNLEEDNKTITIGYSGSHIIGSSEFYGSYQITIPRTVRELLNLEKGDTLGFYGGEEIKIEIRKM